MEEKQNNTNQPASDVPDIPEWQVAFGRETLAKINAGTADLKTREETKKDLKL